MMMESHAIQAKLKGLLSSDRRDTGDVLLTLFTARKDITNVSFHWFQIYRLPACISKMDEYSSDVKRTYCHNLKGTVGILQIRDELR
jgi:hypothetical protein